MKEAKVSNIEKTIDIVSNWINENAKDYNCMSENNLLPNMVEALAKLVLANASLMD